MNENISKVDYKLEMTKRINLAAYAGIFILFVNFVAGIILKKCFTELSYTVYMLYIMLNTCASMLPFLAVYRIKCGKMKELITVPKKARGGFPKWAAAVIFGFGLCTAVNFLISLISAYVFNLGTGSAVNQYISDIPSLCLAVLTVGIAPAVCEELLFRGCIIGSLKEYNTLMSVVISSLIFSLIHSSISGMIFAFMSGMIFGFVRIYTGYFSAAVAVHFMNNALALISAAAGSLVSENVRDIIFYASGIAGIIFSLIVILLIVFKKIRLESIFEKSDSPSAQPVETIIGSSRILLVFILCTIVVDL